MVAALFRNPCINACSVVVPAGNDKWFTWIACSKQSCWLVSVFRTQKSKASNEGLVEGAEPGPIGVPMGADAVQA